MGDSSVLSGEIKTIKDPYPAMWSAWIDLMISWLQDNE